MWFPPKRPDVRLNSHFSPDLGSINTDNLGLDSSNPRQLGSLHIAFVTLHSGNFPLVKNNFQVLSRPFCPDLTQVTQYVATGTETMLGGVQCKVRKTPPLKKDDNRRVHESLESSRGHICWI